MAMYEAVSPYADLTLRSKNFNIHILHHAVATLTWTSKGLDLYTLGHIACLLRNYKDLTV